MFRITGYALTRCKSAFGDRILWLFLFLFPLTLNGVARQCISVGYFDQDKISIRIPNPPFFLKNSPSLRVERGFLLFYERRFYDFPAVSIYLGADVGKWFMNDDLIYTTSVFPAARFWLLHLPYFHPYVEYSMFGPTMLSKESFSHLQFKSNFLFQSFFTVGIEIGELQGLCLSAVILQYNNRSLTPMDSFQVPIMFTAGYLF